MAWTEERFTWQVRVVALDGHSSRAHARNHTLELGRAASFHDRDDHPSAIEWLLSALGGDLIDGWTATASRAGLPRHDVELRLEATLDEPLAHLGVVGVGGSPAIAAITGTLYLGLPAPPETLAALWRATCERSPLHATLSRACAITIALAPIA